MFSWLISLFKKIVIADADIQQPGISDNASLSKKHAQQQKKFSAPIPLGALIEKIKKEKIENPEEIKFKFSLEELESEIDRIRKKIKKEDQKENFLVLLKIIDWIEVKKIFEIPPENESATLSALFSRLISHIPKTDNGYYDWECYHQIFTLLLKKNHPQTITALIRRLQYVPNTHRIETFEKLFEKIKTSPKRPYRIIQINEMLINLSHIPKKEIPHFKKRLLAYQSKELK